MRAFKLTPRRVGIGLIVILLLWLGWHAYLESSNFRGYPADGPFQLFDPLRRWAAGERAGTDFPLFHGIGTALVHYPIFALFGKNLFAAELARWTLSPLFFAASSFVVLAALTRRRLIALFGTGICLLFGLEVTHRLIFPTNSLLGIRSTVPILVAAAIAAWLPRSRFRPSDRGWLVYGIGLGMLMSVAFVMSVEQGAAILIAYLVTYLVADPARAPWRDQLAHVGVVVAATLVSNLILFGLITGGHPLTPLRYALVDIQQDQFWYFGAPPNRFIGSMPDIFTNLNLITGVLLSGVIGTLTVREYRRAPNRRSLAALVLVTYGLVASTTVLGINAPAYAEPLDRVLLIVTIWLLTERFAFDRLAFDNNRDLQKLFKPAALLLVVFAVLLFGRIPGEVRSVKRVVQPSGPFPVDTRTEGSRLAPSWVRDIKATEKAIGTPPRQGDLWETYTSLYSAQHGLLNPSGYDYIIHALGPQRRQAYVDSFDRTKPRYVFTMDPSFFRYERWLQQETWPWYERLLLNYRPIAGTPFRTIWRRDEESWREPSGKWRTARFDREQARIPDKAALMVVEVRYKIHDADHWVPVIGRLPRYLVDLSDTAGRRSPAVSLPPHGGTWQFPVFTLPGQDATLRFRTKSLLPGPSLEVTDVRYRALDVGSERVRILLFGERYRPRTVWNNV